jgi:hypothetical protein
MPNTGLATVAGALIAFVGVVVGNLLTSRGQRARANQQALREAAGAYLSTVDVFLDHARELRSSLEARSPGTAARREQQHQLYLEAWTQLRARLPVLRISGPETIAHAADQLRYTVGAYADALDGWYARASAQESAKAPAKIEEQSKSVVTAVYAFERAVRPLTGFASPRWRQMLSRPPRAAGKAAASRPETTD